MATSGALDESQHGVARARGEQDVAGVEVRALVKDEVALVKVLAPRADVGAFGRGLVEANVRAVGGHVLLDDDRVGAVGKGRAGEDAHALALFDAARERPAGGAFANELQRRGTFRKVGATHRVAVHGG